ncbi:conserved hypothetical protein [Leishmania mexicana MHOM/GT/2001/U1103]|uniref:Uncharacterized protein n=1 Tax=Leishmania mexicana (strain MHOM/GT/2001/U1103) TaxID=929439 RepID=E9AMT8_LEIMU|nr:conserved hypothetical protein [Leishmania mexicana MHOM/GT/2001/U1103]CBZ24243.1 conserved hypothetical protein [Leishmania mexicana MHOM/GT/2001/U1103]
MYAFSLASNRKSAISDPSGLAPPAVEHVIRAPSELKSHQRVPQPSNEADDDDDVMQVSNAHFGWHPAHEHVPTSSLYVVHPPAEQLVHVHNLNSYMGLRDAADWSVEVQREREQKKRRALAQHEAVKLEEQRHRDAQEEQTKKEMRQRRLERQQQRAELREADVMANFQDRNTQFLQSQLWLMQLGSYVKQRDAQHKAHAYEALHKTASSRNHLDVGHTSTTSWTGTNVRGHHASAPSTEIGLREAAEATEEAYVRLSLAYRNEAQRSRAAAAILNPGERTGKGRSRPPATRSAGALASSTSPSQAATAVSAPSHSPATSPAPTPVTEAAAKVSAPFHTAPPMFTHTSTENMGQHANAIPYTYIPEYFDAPSAPAAATGKVPAPRRTREPPEQQETGAVMPLPLSPAPVGRDVTGALQARYYPWALYSTAAVRESMLPPLPPPREASLPVRRWGAAELRDSMFGHCILEDGTIQDQCERKKVCAAHLSYTTLPRDNATATSNAPVEPQEPLHFGKRMDIWL